MNWLDSQTVKNTTYFFESRLLRSESVIAGFSTRAGGDDVDTLASAAGFDRDHFYTVKQVHGRRLLTIEGDEDPHRVWTEEADGLVTSTPGVALAVKTADCVPLLLADGAGEVVAAVHAGWRGFVAGIVQGAVAELESRWGARRSELRAAIGPAIDACCFEVGEEVVAEIAAVSSHPGVVLRGGGRRKPSVDLRLAIGEALLEAGLEAERIERVGPCTRCSASLLHSYRRDGAGKGRQLSFVFRI